MFIPYAVLIFIFAVSGWSQAAELQYFFPVQPVRKKAFSQGGHSYPAIDIFGRRGMSFVAPVSGVVEDIQKIDEWDAGAPDLEKKGGRWVSFIGDDGFRYYGSHLESVSEQIYLGQHIKAGEFLGRLGDSGNAAGKPIHLHFGVSYASSPYNWKTRRGEIEPYHFLTCILQKGCDPRTALAGQKAAVRNNSVQEP
jgi:peptidoglycan LD-endopeptidase LytH